jgi:hypothetical protein
MKKLLATIVLVFALSPALAAGFLPPFALPIPNFTVNGGLPKWKVCRAKVQANKGNCTVLVIGESTPRGLGAMFSGSSFDAASGAWPAQVAVQLKQIYGLNAQANSISGSGNIGNMAAFVAYDTRVVTPGNWTIQGGPTCSGATLFAGGCAFRAAASDTTAFQFNPGNITSYPSAPTVPTDTLDVYSVNVNLSAGYGVISIKVNGGASLATIAQNGAGPLTYTKTTVSTGSAAADNTWQLACTSSIGCQFDAIVARNSAVKEASFINMGISGATAGLWATTGPIYNPLAGIQNLYQPDLCIIQEQGNDQDAPTAIATYMANYQAIIDACKASGDVLIVTSQQGQAGAACGSCGGGIIPYYDTQQTYVVAQRQIATTNNLPILDWWTTMCGTVSGSGSRSTCSRGGWTAGVANGWNGSFNGIAQDIVHQGPYAYAVLAAQIAMILMGP